MSRFVPRLSSSTKWTEVPEEFLLKVRTVFNNQFKTEAAAGEFIANGHIYPQEIALRVGYLENGRLKQINFEASMDLKPLPGSTGAGATSDGASMKGPATISDIPNYIDADIEDRAAEETGSTIDRLYVCIDALGSLMEEYFQTGDVGAMDVPLRWKSYEFEGEEVFLQYSTVNTRLEEEADRLLGLLGDDLVREENSSEDAMAGAEVDSELAEDIQKAIRNGTYRPNIPDADEPN
jgi:hypothetical protein